MCIRDSERAAPYHFETDGLQFHHLPDTPIAPLYRHYSVEAATRQLRLTQPYTNPNWTHASRGMTHYVRRCVESFRAGNIKDGCAFLGWLFHVLQDSGFGPHSLEGPDGTDCFVLQRLFPENEDPRLDPLTILEDVPPPPPPSDTREYVPRLLGFTAEEATLHLYTRYAAMAAATRRGCHQIVTHAHEGRTDRNTPIFHAMYKRCAYLCADVLYTILCVATRRCETDTAALLRVTLSDLEPIQRPWLVSPPYGHHAMVRDGSLDNGGRRLPLQLFLSDTGLPVTYRKGLGLGAQHAYSLSYELPRGLYAALDSALGLHAKTCRQGEARLTLLIDGAPAYTALFNKDKPAERLHIPHPGGRLELRVEVANSAQAAHTHIVWADPILERCPPAWE